MKLPPTLSRRTVCILCSILFSLESLGQVQNSVSRQEPEQSKYPNSDAVYVLDEGKIELKDDGTARGKFHVKLKILNERGLHFKSLQLLGGKSKKITDFKGNVIKPDGRERQIKYDDILEVSYSSQNRVYRDLKVKSVLFREVFAGCVLDYQYDVHYDSFIDLPDWVFNGSRPVERSIFSIQFSSKIKLSYYVTSKDSTIRFEKNIKDGDTLLVWSAHNLPPIAIEPNMPNLSSLRSRVLFWTPAIRFKDMNISFAEWSGLTNWFLDRLEGKFNLDRRVFVKIPAYSATLTDEQKTKIIYEFVQESFREIELDFGEGGYEPNDAQAVLRRRYGDIKDIAVVLTSLLRLAKIEAYPVLLRTRDFGPIIEEIVTLRQFDHMLVAAIINGDTLYMDPTHSVCPFKLLPSYAQESHALIIKRDNSLFQKTPAFPARLSDFRQMYEVDFDSAGTMFVKGRILADGLVADALRAFVKAGTKKEVLRFAEDYFNSHVPGIKLLRHSFASIRSRTIAQDSSLAYVEGQFAFRRDLFFSPSDSLIFFSPNMLNRTRVPAYVVHPEDERVHPVVFENKFTEFDSVTIRIPHGYEVIFMPSEVNVDEQFARYQAANSKVGDLIRFRRFFEVKSLWLDKKDYKVLYEFYRKIAISDQAEVIFRKLPQN